MAATNRFIKKKQQASILALSNFRFSYSDNIDEEVLQQLEQCDIFAEFNTYEIMQHNNNSLNDNIKSIENGFRSSLPPPPELIPVESNFGNDCSLSEVLNPDTISPSSFNSHQQSGNSKSQLHSIVTDDPSNGLSITPSPGSLYSANNDNNKRTYEDAFLVNTLNNTMKNLAEIYAIPDELRPRPRKRQKTKHLEQNSNKTELDIPDVAELMNLHYCTT